MLGQTLRLVARDSSFLRCRAECPVLSELRTWQSTEKTPQGKTAEVLGLSKEALPGAGWGGR